MSNDKQEKSLLDKARQLAADYNKRATEFSERIKAFQSWLRRLEFRVKAKVDFDVASKSHLLLFTDPNSTWELQVNRMIILKKGVKAWMPLGRLEDCSVEVKVAAAHAFPDLLENLIKAQFEAIDEIDAAHTILDEVAEKIGRFEEEAE